MTQAFIDALFTIIVTLVTTAIGVAGTWMMTQIGKKQGFERTALAIKAVEGAAIQTVHDLQQTFVESWKAEGGGKLTDKQIKDLKDKLDKQTREKLANPIINLLTAAGADVSQIITSAAEAEINFMKAGNEIKEGVIE